MSKPERVAPLREAFQKGAPTPRVRTLSPFDGLEDNNLGNMLPVKPGETQRVLKMHGRDDMPNVLSVSCGFTLQDVETVPVDVAPVGIITFGAGGSNARIEFDLLSGMVFNVPGTSFDLDIFNETPLEPAQGLSGATILAFATTGIGGAGRAGSNPLRRTIRIGEIQPNTGVLVEVPQGSVSFNVYTSVLGALGGLQATQSLSPVNTIPLTTTVNPQFDIGLGAQNLVGGARAVEIYNNGGAAADGVRVSFTLAF